MINEIQRKIKICNNLFEKVENQHDAIKQLLLHFYIGKRDFSICHVEGDGLVISHDSTQQGASVTLVSTIVKVIKDTGYFDNSDLDIGSI